MERIWNLTKSTYSKLLSPTSLKIFFLAFMILAILCAFKYVFLASCISVGNIKECTASGVNSSDTLFALGGILVAILAIIPTFWNERRVEDIKREIEGKIFDSVKEDMSKVVQAQEILLSLPKFSDTLTGYIEIQDNIERAVLIWPPLKQAEYRKWGITMAQTIIYGIVYPADLKTWIVTNSIRYLEESVRNVTDAEALAYLACMYGYRNEYASMISTIKKATKIEDGINEKFQGNLELLTLIRACGNNRNLMEKLGDSIGIELPVLRDGFCKVLRKVDWVEQGSKFLNWTAIKKPNRAGMQGRFTIKIMASDELDGEKVYASCYNQEDMKGNVYSPETKIGDHDNPVTLEKLYEDLNKSFLLIGTIF